jgi:hypothetical protein
MPEPIFMKLGMYIMAPESISTGHFMNLSHQYVYPSVIARQQLGKTMEELLHESFSLWSLSYQRKVGS